jgi:hypothetical protein
VLARSTPRSRTGFYDELQQLFSIPRTSQLASLLLAAATERAQGVAIVLTAGQESLW